MDGIPPVDTLLDGAVLGGGGGGALFWGVGGGMPGLDPGIGGILLARGMEFRGVVGEVGDASFESVVNFWEIPAVVVAGGWRGLLGNDGAGPLGGIAVGPSRLKRGAISPADNEGGRLRFSPEVSSSNSESASGDIGGGGGKGRATGVSTRDLSRPAAELTFSRYRRNRAIHR